MKSSLTFELLIVRCAVILEVVILIECVTWVSWLNSDWPRTRARKYLEKLNLKFLVSHNYVVISKLLNLLSKLHAWNLKVETKIIPRPNWCDTCFCLPWIWFISNIFHWNYYHTFFEIDQSHLMISIINFDLTPILISKKFEETFRSEIN